MTPDLKLAQTEPPKTHPAKLQRLGDLEFLCCPACDVMQRFTEYDWPGEHVVVCPICWEHIEVIA
jgi:hypothetical protein